MIKKCVDRGLFESSFVYQSDSQIQCFPGSYLGDSSGGAVDQRYHMRKKPRRLDIIRDEAMTLSEAGPIPLQSPAESKKKKPNSKVTEHSPEILYSCEGCKSDFRSLNVLRRHLKNCDKLLKTKVAAVEYDDARISGLHSDLYTNSTSPQPPTYSECPHPDAVPIISDALEILAMTAHCISGLDRDGRSQVVNSVSISSSPDIEYLGESQNTLHDAKVVDHTTERISPCLDEESATLKTTNIKLTDSH